jgi:hypothetical protein
VCSCESLCSAPSVLESGARAQRVFNRRALPQVGSALRLLLAFAQRLQQGFLRVNRDRAPSAGGRAGRAKGAGMADGRGEVGGRGARDDRRRLVRRTEDARLGELDRKRVLRKPTLVGTCPCFGPNRDPVRVEVANAWSPQVAPIDEQFGQRS